MLRTEDRQYLPEWFCRFAVVTLKRLDGLTVFPFVVFEKELPVLFDEGLDDRKGICLESLVLRGVGIIESPLSEWNVSADKVD